jgi:hypothetical protein
MENPHHKYEDASVSWGEIDMRNSVALNASRYGYPTNDNVVDITKARLHNLNVISDKYDYAMRQVGKCQRLGFAPQCTCEAECVLVQMHNKWKFEQ